MSEFSDIRPNKKYRVGITLYGTPEQFRLDVSQVSGLMIWQRRYVGLLEDLGFEVVKFFFVKKKGAKNLLEKIESNQFIFYLKEASQVFYMEEEGEAHGLVYNLDAKHLEELIVDTLENCSLDALFIVNWISTGMAVWRAGLRFNKPVIFTPTEHSAICHLGFLLHPSGEACVGPNGGKKCSTCTHGVKPIQPNIPNSAPWYSKRFKVFHLIANVMPRKFQDQIVTFLAKVSLPHSALLTEKQSEARFTSVRKFLLSDKIYVAFQSTQQHSCFERAISNKINLKLPIAISENRVLNYSPDFDRRLQRIDTDPVQFLFVARSSFDRGLNFLLDAWGKCSPFCRSTKLFIRSDEPASFIKSKIDFLRKSGCEIDMQYGKLDDQEYLELHRKVHFVINPAIWEEPLAGGVIEGFSLGTPAIVPKKTGSASYVADGDNGYLFEFRSSESLIKCLERAVNQMQHWESLHLRALSSSYDYKIKIDLQFKAIHQLVRDNSGVRGEYE